MGTEEYGKYALVLTIISLFGLIYFGPLTQGFIRFYHHYQRKNLINTYKVLMYRLIGYSIIIMFIISITMTALNSAFNFSESSLFILAAGIFIIFFKTDEFFSNSLNIVRKRKENSLLQGFEKLIIISTLLLLIYIKKLQLTAVLCNFALIALLFTIIKFYVFKKISSGNEILNVEYSRNTNKEIYSTIFQYASPFLIWGIAGWIQLNSEKWIINKFLSLSDVGIYAVMMSLVNALVILPNTIISDFSIPIIFQNFSDLNDTTKIKTSYKYIRIIIFIVTVLTLFSAVITFLFGKTLIILISNSSYAVYSYLLPVLCIGTGFFYIGQAMCNIGLVLNRPKQYILPKIVTGLITVTLNIILIINFGIKGIAITVLLAGIIYSVFINLVNKKMLPEAVN